MPSKDFKTPTCRFSFLHNMFKRVTKTDDNGNPVLDDQGNPITEQKCTLIFDKSVDRSVFDEAIKEAIVEKWGEEGIGYAKKGLLKLPFLAGDGKEARSKKTGDIYEGLGPDKFFIRVATRKEAPVHYKSMHMPAKFGKGEDEVKSGDYGFAVLNAFAWENKKSGKGVSFGVKFLQKTKNGESLGGDGGVVNAADWFEQIEDAGEAPESTKNGMGAEGLFG